MDNLQQKLGVSQRRACKVIDQPSKTQRRTPKVKADEEALRTAIIDLALQYGRYGYRHITEMLKREGFRVNHKRVERIWREEGLRYPRGSPKENGFGSMTAPA